MLKHIGTILEKAGKVTAKIETKVKHAESKAIVKGLVESFNKGRAQVDIDHKTGQRTTTIIDEDEPRQMEFPFEDDSPF